MHWVGPNGCEWERIYVISRLYKRIQIKLCPPSFQCAASHRIIYPPSHFSLSLLQSPSNLTPILRLFDFDLQILDLAGTREASVCVVWSEGDLLDVRARLTLSSN
ncbi:unnamed protein product [Eruca vesicaria subsp. sativa]|uniref:Uncharacterized protein n=1 Tax=Eruca vesicaria subsp. sativa TaxID=29727 RepID=A0ABC8L2D7_ERUVS|nr:unnamed protein product [Eruca vesicaria subsp. sativa]